MFRVLFPEEFDGADTGTRGTLLPLRRFGLQVSAQPGRLRFRRKRSVQVLLDDGSGKEGIRKF